MYRYAIAFCAVIGFLVLFVSILEFAWFRPGRAADRVQQDLEQLFDERGINGFVRVLFYMESVEIKSTRLSREDVDAIMPHIRKLRWLRFLTFRVSEFDPALEVLINDSVPAGVAVEFTKS